MRDSKSVVLTVEQCRAIPEKSQGTDLRKIRICVNYFWTEFFLNKNHGHYKIKTA